MEKKNVFRKNVLTAIAGFAVLVVVAVFSFNSVKKMILESEQESLKSMAAVNAQSLEASLQGKRDLIYAALSGDMKDISDVEKGILKLHEKATYISNSEMEYLEAWEEEMCEIAMFSPSEVIPGPVRKSEEGYYILYMTKSISINGLISGCVQIELNLDEIYSVEQGLKELQLGNGGYCIVKYDDITIMPSDYEETELTISHDSGNGCTIEEVYEMNTVTPQSKRKLIAYDMVQLGDEEFTFYIIEDYDQVMQPIENVSFYITLLSAAVLLWAIIFVYKIIEHQKKEALLVKELQHEKILNETMKKQEGLMQKYNHSKTMSVLTGSIAHEFNNLMTPIVLYADLLEENEVVYNEMPEEIDELKSATRRCEELARQLLGYSRQGKAEKVLTEYDATYAVTEAVNIVRKLLPSNIEFKVNICKTPYYICGQVGALNQILLNLATNAVHAMESGGKLNIQFGLSTDDDKYVRLVVEDTGGGIPKEIQMQIFQPFFTTKRDGKGTGIGLTVVKRLTEEHGGRVKVKTEEGKGTIFILDDVDITRKKIMSAVTDNENKIYYDEINKPGISNLLSIIAVIKNIEIDKLVLKYKDYNYKDFKIEVANIVCEFILDIQDKFYKYRNDEDYLKEVLKNGKKRVSVISNNKLDEVKSKIGIKL